MCRQQSTHSQWMVPKEIPPSKQSKQVPTHTHPVIPSWLLTGIQIHLICLKKTLRCPHCIRNEHIPLTLQIKIGP